MPIGVAGYGEGGLIALYSAALDPRIQATLVSGYFQQRDGLWKEPIYRDVWGLLREFGDAEIASLIAPRGHSSLRRAVARTSPDLRHRLKTAKARRRTARWRTRHLTRCAPKSNERGRTSINCRPASICNSSSAATATACRVARPRCRLSCNCWELVARFVRRASPLNLPGMAFRPG